MEAEASNGTSLIVSETLSIGLQAVSVLLNAAILSTLWKKSLFSCPSNRLVFSLCFSHLLLSSLSILISATQSFITSPKGLSVTISPDADADNDLTTVLSLTEPLADSRSSLFLSHALLYLTLCVAIGTSITIALISLERYVTIARPMKYKSIVTRGRCTAMILVTWLFSILSTLLPILIFGNQTTLHGTISIPSGGLGLYYAILLTSATLLVLIVMILCYAKIFKIAKEKCVKVQIGHLASPVSSISSDWPASVYSSHDGQQDVPHAVQHSLLHYVLMANLGKHSPIPKEPYVLTVQGLGHVEHEIVTRTDGPLLLLHESQSKRSQNITQSSCPDRTSNKRPNPSSKSRSRSSSSKPVASAWIQHQPRVGRKWRTFLQQNYNSPRKTVSTIVLLIGSVFLTQVPLSCVLFRASYVLFHFTFKILFAFASIASPLLYGFLNRSIRVHLWKFLRINSRNRDRRRAFDLVREKSWDSRKASISSEDSQVFPHAKRQKSVIQVHEVPETNRVGKGIPDEAAPSLSNGMCPMNIHVEKKAENCAEKVESESSANVPAQADEPEADPELLSSSFPRKPSQDSGADVSFSEDEADDGEVEAGEESSDMPSCSRRIRVPPRCQVTAEMLMENCGVDDTEDWASEDEWEDEFGEDEEFERMRDLIRKKFSITGEDEGSSSGVEDEMELGQPVQV